MTTRLTPAACAARTARSAPSRAGTIRSSSVLTLPVGSGEAMCWTKSHPAVASAQPASFIRSAAVSGSCVGGDTETGADGVGPGEVADRAADAPAVGEQRLDDKAGDIPRRPGDENLALAHPPTPSARRDPRDARRPSRVIRAILSGLVRRPWVPTRGRRRRRGRRTGRSWRRTCRPAPSPWHRTPPCRPRSRAG